MKRLLPLLLIIAIALTSACTSGKRAYKSGDYKKAVLSANKRLRKSPTNKKAKATLKSAYPQMIKYYQSKIDIRKRSSDVYKWEKILPYYEALNQVHDEIQRCPGALKVVRPKSFATEYRQVKTKAAETRYDMGIKSLNRKTRQGAKEAFYHFEEALQFAPTYKDTRNKMEEARDLATLYVVIEPIPMHSQTLALSNRFFESQIVEFAKNERISPFIQFYTAREAQSRNLGQADNVVRMIFDDFVVGQTSVQERIIERKRDSVVVGQVNITKDSVADVYGTVRAKVHYFRKTISSSGLLDFKIMDGHSHTILSQRKFPGTFVWESEWGFFNGDENALNDDDRRLIRNRELPNPPPQDLFIEFTKPIFSQLTRHLGEYYERK